MSEKRFTYFNTTGWNKDGFLNVMNGLNEKNKKLQKENKQLKQKVDFYKYFQKDARELEKENEQLKKENKSMEKTLDKLIQLKETEIKQQRFFIELIEEILPLDDSIKRSIHQRTIRSNIYD